MADPGMRGVRSMMAWWTTAVGSVRAPLLERDVDGEHVSPIGGYCDIVREGAVRAISEGDPLHAEIVLARFAEPALPTCPRVSLNCHPGPNCHPVHPGTQLGHDSGELQSYHFAAL